MNSVLQQRQRTPRDRSPADPRPTPSERRSLLGRRGLLGLCDELRHLRRVLDEGIVLGLVADDAPGVGYRPELVVVGGDTLCRPQSNKQRLGESRKALIYDTTSKRRGSSGARVGAKSSAVPLCSRRRSGRGCRTRRGCRACRCLRNAFHVNIIS